MKNTICLFATLFLFLILVSCGKKETVTSSNSTVFSSVDSQVSSVSEVSSIVSEVTPSSVASSDNSSVSSALSASSKTSSQKNTSVGSSSAKSENSSNSNVSSISADNRKKIGETAIEQDIEITVSSIQQVDDKVTVKVKIKNTSLLPHPVSMAQRYHLVNADGDRVAASVLTDLSGTDARTKTLEVGETFEAIAQFTLPSDFDPLTFTYTYDIMGFRSVKYKIK